MEQPRHVIDFPTLLVAAEWVEAHCIVPDGFEKGQWFGLVDWQAWALLNFYRVKPDAKVGQLASAFFYRRSQIVLPQKAGKAPYTAAHICVEGVGPALFAGWAKGGEVWDCRDHGCGCGWVHEYQPGEAMGQRWPTPLIQITAFSEKQTDNIYSALRPMIDDGPLHELIPKTGEEFIRLPGNGRIDVVTSEARSRLGARVTFVPQDETGIWTPAAGMVKVAETQRRGLTGMGGRAEETTNAWDPNEGSVAQRTADAAKKLGDIFRHHPLAPKGLSYKNKADRRKIHKYVYEGCRWIDEDGVEAEAAELITVDAVQAERFFGNRPVAGSGLAFDSARFEELRAPNVVKLGSLIVLGVDGAPFQQALPVIATDVHSGYQWPIIIVERPDDAKADYEHPLDDVAGAVIQAFTDYIVWKAYCDPQWIENMLEGLQGRFGKERVKPWYTNRPMPMAWAVRNYTEAIGAGDMVHAKDEVFERHIANAHKKATNVLDDEERPMHIIAKETPHSASKIDAASAAVVSWEARGDCIRDGGLEFDPHSTFPDSPAPRSYGPDEAPPAEWFGGRETVGPMGSMS